MGNYEIKANMVGIILSSIVLKKPEIPQSSYQAYMRTIYIEVGI